MLQKQLINSCWFKHTLGMDWLQNCMTPQSNTDLDAFSFFRYLWGEVCKVEAEQL